jgi:hypothetical protein
LKRSDLDAHDSNSGTDPTTLGVAFSEQQIAKIYENADEVQHMPPFSEEKAVLDAHAHNLGTEGKSDSQSCQMPDLIPDIISEGIELEDKTQVTMLESQEKPEKARSFFLSVLKSWEY